ncbi:MAG: ATP-binding protein [Acidobacteria bacterium]|nr:ATP-binding protein [Acidobacteriota bacterium]
MTALFPAELGRFPEMTAFIREGLAALGAGKDVLDTAHVVADELIANVIRHAYPDAPPVADGGGRPLWITVGGGPGRFQVEIADRGRPFNPLCPEGGPPGKGGARGGFGLSVVKGLADDLRYERTGGENRVTFTLAAK